MADEQTNEGQQAPPAEPPKTDPPVDDSWKQVVPEKYHRDTPEESFAEWRKGFDNLSKLAGKPKDERLALSGNGPVKTVGDVAARLGVSMDELVDTYSKEGKLPEELAKKIDEGGQIGAELVAKLVEGEVRSREASKQANEAVYQKAVAAVGGEKAAQAEIAWANENLSQEERETFQAMISDKDGNFLPTAGAALRAIRAQRIESLGSSSSPATNSNPSTAGLSTEPFKDWREAHAYKQSPRFTTDPAYQAAYFERLKPLTGG